MFLELHCLSFWGPHPHPPLVHPETSYDRPPPNAPRVALQVSPAVLEQSCVRPLVALTEAAGGSDRLRPQGCHQSLAQQGLDSRCEHMDKSQLSTAHKAGVRTILLARRLRVVGTPAHVRVRHIRAGI